MRKTVATLLLLCFSLFGSHCFAANKASAPVYLFGVVPQFDALHTQQIWAPIVQELGLRTKLTIQLYIPSSIDQFERDVAEGKFDFAYMNPYHLVVANKKQGYVPILRDVGSDLFGVLVVKNDSSYQTVQDLQGKQIALPATNAFGASLMIQADLLDLYQVSMTPIYAQNHDSVYLNVAMGLVDAGGGVQKTLQQQSPLLRNQLRTIYQTRKVVSHPIVVHPRVSAADQISVKKQLLALSETDSGRNLLNQVPIKKLGETSLKDFDSIAEMALERFSKK